MAGFNKFADGLSREGKPGDREYANSTFDVSIVRKSS